MSKYICNICGYVYDEEKGIPELGIAPGTKWEDISHDFVCPLCKAVKSNFKKDGETTAENTVIKPIEIDHDLKELSALEMSILCSNLARGCEKQYLPHEQEQFTKLANFFKSAMPKADIQSTRAISTLINKDLEKLIPYANQIATEYKDRGALRALVWNEKATRILNSLLERYNSEGAKMLENTGVFVCSICGFIHIGNELPEVCPICKVPNYKFEKIERSA